MEKRILVLEDKPDLALGLKNNLEQEGYVVVVAHDGDTANDLLASQHFDGAIVDLMIPGRNGFELVAAARQRGDGPRILVLTARDARRDRERALALGADDFMLKPFSILELLVRLDAILQEKPAPPTAAQVGEALRRYGTVMDDDPFRDGVPFGACIYYPHLRKEMGRQHPQSRSRSAFYNSRYKTSNVILLKSLDRQLDRVSIWNGTARGKRDHLHVTKRVRHSARSRTSCRFLSANDSRCDGARWAISALLPHAGGCRDGARRVNAQGGPWRESGLFHAERRLRARLRPRRFQRRPPGWPARRCSAGSQCRCHDGPLLDLPIIPGVPRPRRRRIAWPARRVQTTRALSG